MTRTPQRIQKLKAKHRIGQFILSSYSSNWKAVAEDAFKSGIVGGVSVGIQGVRAGAAATLAAGNPLVGGLVGGAIGFAIGFVSGAAVGGGAKLLSDCLFNSKTIGKMQSYTCSGQVYYSYSMDTPNGCTPGGGILASGEGSPYDLRGILGITLLPNYGSQSISDEALRKMNLVL